MILWRGCGRSGSNGIVCWESFIKVHSPFLHTSYRTGAMLSIKIWDEQDRLGPCTHSSDSLMGEERPVLKGRLWARITEGHNIVSRVCESLLGVLTQAKVFFETQLSSFCCYSCWRTQDLSLTYINHQPGMHMSNVRYLCIQKKVTLQ